MKLNLPDPQEALIDDLARRLNIRRIGWIFTDLVPDESKSGGGPVLHHRGNVVGSKAELQIHCLFSIEFLFFKCPRMHHGGMVSK